MVGAERPRPVRTCRFGYRGRRVRSVWRVRVYLDRVRVADDPRTKLPESRNRRSSFATGFKYALKHVSVLYEFSTLIRAGKTSVSAHGPSTRRLLKVPESPSATSQCRAAGGPSFSAGPNVFTAFQSPPRALIQLMRSEPSPSDPHSCEVPWIRCVRHPVSAILILGAWMRSEHQYLFCRL